MAKSILREFNQSPRSRTNNLGNWKNSFASFHSAKRNLLEDEVNAFLRSAAVRFLEFEHDSMDFSTPNIFQVLANKRGATSVRRLHSSKGMQSRPLSSANDAPGSNLQYNLPSSANRSTGGVRAATAVHDLLRRFNPRLVGFGIVDPSSSHPSSAREVPGTAQPRISLGAR